MRNQPVSLVVNASRHLALGIAEPGAVWKILLWSAALPASTVPRVTRAMATAVAWGVAGLADQPLQSVPRRPGMQCGGPAGLGIGFVSASSVREFSDSCTQRQAVP